MAGLNESKILRKHMSCKSKWKFMVQNVIRIKGDIITNVGGSAKPRKI